MTHGIRAVAECAHTAALLPSPRTPYAYSAAHRNRTREATLAARVSGKAPFVAVAEEEQRALETLPEPTQDPAEVEEAVVTEAEGYRLVLSHKSSTGYLGVTPRGSRFQARYRSGGKLVHLGSYGTATEAAVAYVKHAQSIGGAEENGEEEWERQQQSGGNSQQNQRLDSGITVSVVSPRGTASSGAAAVEAPAVGDKAPASLGGDEVLEVVAMSDDEEEDEEDTWAPPPQVERLPDDNVALVVDSQCERDPRCTRGFRHNGFGGSCSSRAPKRRRLDAQPDIVPRRRMWSKEPNACSRSPRSALLTPPTMQVESVAVGLHVTPDGSVGMQLCLMFLPTPAAEDTSHGSNPLRGMDRVPLAAPSRTAWNLHPYWPAPKPRSGRAAVLEALAAGCATRAEVATYVVVCGAQRILNAAPAP